MPSYRHIRLLLKKSWRQRSRSKKETLIELLIPLFMVAVLMATSPPVTPGEHQEEQIFFPEEELAPLSSYVYVGQDLLFYGPAEVRTCLNKIAGHDLVSFEYDT